MSESGALHAAAGGGRGRARGTGPLADQVALVTGAGRGLGRAYALHLASLGADIVVNDIRLDSAVDVGESLSAPTVMDEVEALGRRAIGIAADVRDKASVDAMVDEAVGVFGRLDILVNNAGGSLAPHDRSYPSIMPEEDVRWMLDLNLLGAIFCSQAAIRHMKPRRAGRIVNAAAHAGITVIAEWGGSLANYSIAKAGLVHYTRLLAAEVGPHGIRVNAIAPASVHTVRVDAATGWDDPEREAEWARQIPLRRIGTPLDVARVVEFLVTDLSGYVTGQCISVCGGLYLGPS